MAAGTGNPGRRPANALVAALDLPPRPWPHLFFRLLLAHFSNQRTDRPARHPSRRRVPGRRRSLLSWFAAILVCANLALVRLRESRPDAGLLARIDRFRCRRPESVAARHSGSLPGVFFIVCGGSAGFF